MKGDLATRLNSATVHIGRALRKPSGGEGFAAEHRSALSVLVFAGPIRMSALAAMEGVGAPAITRTVRILERKGVARRRTDPADERAVLVEPTATGTRIVREGRDARVRAIASALRRMPGVSRARLSAAVDDLELLVQELERGTS